MGRKLKSAASKLEDALEIIRRKNAEIDDLRATLRRTHRENDTAEAIRQEIWKLQAHNVEPPEWTLGRGSLKGDRGCPITIWSDWHFGEVVDPDQVGGVNKYNSSIARKRIYRLYDTTVDLAFHHMGKTTEQYPGIIVCLGGDMIGGDIHEELLATNDKTPHQAVNELTDIIAAGLEQLATKFGRVYVPCVVGNHGRSTKRMPFKNRVFTNYDWSIYCNLARYFKREKNIRIDVPNSADAHFRCFGTRYMLTHGDSLGTKGGDGIIGFIGPIVRGHMKVGRSEAQVGRDFDVLLLGHWHQQLWLPNVIVNNSLKGYDEFAMLALRAQYSRPSQALWFNHPEHGITARWEIFLEGKRAAGSREWVSWPGNGR